MSGTQGTLLGLGFVVLVITLVVVMGGRRRRWIEAAGFVPAEGPEAEIRQLTEGLLELQPRTVFRTKDPDETALLVDLEPPGTDDAAMTMLVYRLPQTPSPEVAVFHTSALVGRFLRRATGGAYARLEPFGEDFADAGWEAFREPGSTVPPALVDALHRSVRMAEADVLRGIAVLDSRLVLWTDSGIKKLLAAGPKIRDELHNGPFPNTPGRVRVGEPGQPMRRTV